MMFFPWHVALKTLTLWNEGIIDVAWVQENEKLLDKSSGPSHVPKDQYANVQEQYF
jgi:hypothetical protein